MTRVVGAHGGAVVDLPEDLVEQYLSFGWTLETPAEAKDKPFSQLNKDELTALAAVEEIDISGASTNDEIRAAIKAARDSK